MSRMYFNSRGQYRGMSMGLGGAAGLGLLWLLLLPLLALVWYIPRFVWSLPTRPAVRVGILVALYGCLAVAGAINASSINADAASQGCIPIANWTIDSNPQAIGLGADCPNGYAPGPDYFQHHTLPTGAP